MGTGPAAARPEVTEEEFWGRPVPQAPEGSTPSPSAGEVARPVVIDARALTLGEVDAAVSLIEECIVRLESVKLRLDRARQGVTG